MYHARSRNLYDWELLGLAKGDINRVDVTGHTYQEGAFAFRWKGWFWIVADPHKGLAVYRSKDAVNWEYQGIIMYEPGKRFADNTRLAIRVFLSRMIGHSSSTMCSRSLDTIRGHTKPAMKFIRKSASCKWLNLITKMVS